MGKLDDKVDFYADFMKNKLNMKSVDRDLLHAVTKGCGPAIYKADASKVSSSDKAEMDTVKQNFCVKKLGCPDNAKLDKAIEYAIDKFGKSSRSKHRAVFYYLLTKKLKKEDVFSK